MSQLEPIERVLGTAGGTNIRYQRTGNVVRLFSESLMNGLDKVGTIKLPDAPRNFGYLSIGGLYSITHPYLMIGTVWVDNQGKALIYKQTDTTSGYLNMIYITY